MSDYQWVLPRISVGGVINDYDVPQLQAEKIGYVINVTAHEDAFVIAAGIEQLYLNVGDDGQTKRELFRDTVAPWFKQRWFEDPSKRFNIHCDAGVNRGPSTAMFCLMLLGLSASAAIKGIVTARPICQMGLAYANDAMLAAEDLGFMVR